jgi:hydrogenase maturation protein HypF
LTKVARRCRSDARGYAPAARAAFFGSSAHWPWGANQGDFALIRGGEAIVGPHVGDLEQAAALDDYRAMLGLYREIFAFMPAIVAVDAHAGYLSTQLGEALAAECGAAGAGCPSSRAYGLCLADNGVGGAPIWGCCSTDWGWGRTGRSGAVKCCPAIIAGRTGRRICRRALIGGAAAMREPWRNLLAHLRHAFGPDWRTRAVPVLAHLPDATRLGWPKA